MSDEALRSISPYARPPVRSKLVFNAASDTKTTELDTLKAVGQDMTREPTEMEKRVAQALIDNGDVYPHNFCYIDAARAAIRAMRVPTDAMKDIVWNNQEIRELVEDNTPPINAVWKAMIDAASPPDA